MNSIPRKAVVSRLEAFVDTHLCFFMMQDVIVQPFELITALITFLEFECFVNLAVCEAGLEN